MDKIIIAVCILLVLALFIPIPMHLKDGGTVHYNAIVYDVYDVHSEDSEGEDFGYTIGIIVDIFGFEIFNNTEFVAIDTESPYFCGKVLEKNEKGFLVEVTDGGNGAFAEGEKVQVNTELAGKYDVGDNLRISFDGKVAMSYPPQITCVSSIVKLDKNGKVER